MAVIAPLWVSYLLGAYTWKTILGAEGILNTFLVLTGILSAPTDIFLYNHFDGGDADLHLHPLHGDAALTALEKIPPNLIEASRGSGHGRSRPFSG